MRTFDRYWILQGTCNTLSGAGGRARGGCVWRGEDGKSTGLVLAGAVCGEIKARADRLGALGTVGNDRRGGILRRENRVEEGRDW